jgi:rfaE bifunctional protein nucleotidyltransferase chain/domain
MFNLSEKAVAFLKKNRGKKIVFTNGCFDILHMGHVSYLNEAKNCGEILFLGLNSDSSVKKLKGNDRPINDELSRKFVLENLRSVDFVEIFTEDTPALLIESINPNVLVKGGDWKPSEIVGSDFVLKNGGEVKSLSFKDGHSTTNLITKMQGRT